MATRVMEITLISARNLNNAGILTKTKAFAVAWVSNNYKGRQWTPVDQDNGTDPTWNQVMNFILDEPELQQGRLLLEIAIYTDTILGDKEIGRVSIPLKEFLELASRNKGDSTSAQFVSYQVRKPSGEAKGVLNLSVKLAEKPDFKHQEQSLQAGTRSYEAAEAEPVTAYPAGLDRVAKAEPVTAYPVGLDGPAKVEPVTANRGYPPASSSSYPAANNPYSQGYPPPPHHGYPPPPHHGYPPPPYPPQVGYPPPPPPPPPPHHGYPPPPPPPPHHGYPPPPPPPPHHGYPPYHGRERSGGWLRWPSS